MTSAFAEGWISPGLPANGPVHIARAIAIAALRPDLNGCALWVSGGKFTEIENKFVGHDGQEHCLRNKNNAEWDKGRDFP